MGNAKVCICGHNTTDHKYQYGQAKLWGPCDWYTCDCKEFEFVHEAPARTCRYNEYTGEPVKSRAHNLPTNFKISELTVDGVLPEVDRLRWLKLKTPKKIYNNGEYP